MADGLFARLGGAVSAARSVLMGRHSHDEGAPIVGVEGTYHNVVAPWPLVDRFPTVLGSNLNLTLISAAYRSATMGYRQQFVDILDELLEREPHGFAVLTQRILMVAGARVMVRACRTETDSPDEVEAAQNAELVQLALDRLQGRTAAFAELLWALYYGLVGQELMYEPTPSGILPTALQFIHSRRLAYPDQNAWDLHIWDQGSVSLNIPGLYPTERTFGIRIRDYPDKFIIHAPHVRGDYPTRDGLGRELAFWFALKAMAARGAGQFIERFAKPWAFAYFTTSDQGWEKPRTATADDREGTTSDVSAANAALRALGTGSLTGATLPNSVKIMLEQVKGGMSHKDFIELINREISKATLTNTDMAEAGVNGSRSAAEVRKENLLEVARYDAANFGDTLRRDFAAPIIRINRPHAAHLIPIIDLAVEEKPDAKSMWEVLATAVSMHAPVDADKAAEMTGLPLVPNETKGPDGKPVPRMLYPAKPVELPPFSADRVERAEEQGVNQAGATGDDPTAEEPVDDDNTAA